MDDITVNLMMVSFVDKSNELDYYAKALAHGLVSKQYAISKALGLSDTKLNKCSKISKKRPLRVWSQSVAPATLIFMAVDNGAYRQFWYYLTRNN